MAYPLTPYHLKIINENLPPQFAALKDRYPCTIFNAADHWSKPKFPSGYVPERIEIYYKESARRSAIFWFKGKLDSIDIEEIPVDPDVTLVMVDDIWVYICIKGQVIIDRTEGIQFPSMLTDHELMLRRLIHSISSGNFKEIKE